jgi:SAM-dependent methyltransferase
MSGQGGYLTDVQYTGNFYQFLSPAWLAYIAAINGHAAPRLDGGFTYCELGCGKGLSSLLLAAMHPNGEFHACDFNAEHIAYADKLKAEAGIANVHFHAKSFAQMLEIELPAFDFIVLHGVYSWVPDSVRQEIRDFARSRLKPGGFLMASYNAMPGWAHLQPIRRMMQLHAEGVPGDSLEKARSAYAYVDALAKSGAGYFRTVGEAARHLGKVAEKDIRYVAHEYLTPHGDPFYFADVEAAMAASGMHYAGSMTPANNYAELMIPEAFRARMPAVKSRAALEMHRDFIANTSFRADLFTPMPAVEFPRDLPMNALGSVAFCLTNLPERLPLQGERAGVKYDLSKKAATVRALHARLGQGPAPAEELQRVANLPEASEATFLLQELVVAGHLTPCAPVRPPKGWMHVNSVLTEAAIREQWQEVPLACPETSAGSYSETVHAATIEAASRFGDAPSAAKHILDRLRRHQHPVNRVDGAGKRVAATDEEVMEYVANNWRGLTDRANPNSRLLRQFGLLGQ